jgi:hypothetical protein
MSSILEDAVFSSTSRQGRGIFRFNSISVENKFLIKNISKHQRRHFKNKKQVPWQVLEVLWNMGCMPGNRPPKQGMKARELCDLLTHGNYRNEISRKKGICLRDRIEQEELPEPKIYCERFIKSGRTFIPVSYLRKIPGTIFK